MSDGVLLSKTFLWKIGPSLSPPQSPCIRPIRHLTLVQMSLLGSRNFIPHFHVAFLRLTYQVFPMSLVFFWTSSTTPSITAGFHFWDIATITDVFAPRTYVRPDCNSSVLKNEQSFYQLQQLSAQMFFLPRLVGGFTTICMFFSPEWSSYLHEINAFCDRTDISYVIDSTSSCIVISIYFHAIGYLKTTAPVMVMLNFCFIIYLIYFYIKKVYYILYIAWFANIDPILMTTLMMRLPFLDMAQHRSLQVLGIIFLSFHHFWKLFIAFHHSWWNEKIMAKTCIERVMPMNDKKKLLIWDLQKGK